MLLDIKMVVVPLRLTVPCAVSEQKLLSANPLKTERFENNLRFCGEKWLTNFKFSSLIEMTKVHSSSRRSKLAQVSSASKTEETELEDWCSNLLLFEADKRLSVLGVSLEVLQHILSQANKINV